MKHGTMNLKKNTTEVQYKTGNVLIAYPLWRVRATIVAVEKQKVLHIMSACL